MNETKKKQKNWTSDITCVVFLESIIDVDFRLDRFYEKIYFSIDQCSQKS